MKLSFKKINITPQKPCMQAGYVQRDHPFESVHDDIYSTIFVLENQTSKIVWIGADLIGFNEEFIQLLINKTKKYDIYLDSSNLVLGGTHNHSAPTVNVIYDEYFGEPNLEYVEYLSDLYTDSIVELWNENGVEVQAKYCSAMIDGLYSNRNDANKLSDKVVHLLGFFNKNELIATFCNMSCHNTVLGPKNYQITSEVFGMTRNHLEERLGGIFLMSNGNAGDMGNRQYRTGQEFVDCEKMAANLADQIVRKHTDWQSLSLEHLEYKHIEFRKTIILDSNIYIEKIAEFNERLKHTDDLTERKVLLSGIAGFEHKMSYGDGPHELIMPAEIFTFDDLQIICIPGELGSILGLQIKAASKKKHSILWGYTGPCDLGYIVDEEAYKLECQETNTTIYPCGTPEEYRDYIISEL